MSSTADMEDLRHGLYMAGTQFIRANDRDTVTLNGDDFGFNSFDESDADEDIPYGDPQTGQKSRKRPVSPSATAGKAAKRPKAPGAKPAIGKPVTEDRDTDDERIMQLKDAGHSDEYICKKLADEKRISYRKGTINSRVLRIRKMREKIGDDKLDDELSDWHEGEDDKLQQSVEFTEEQFQRELQKLVDKKWQSVSVVLDNLRPDKPKKYTAKACKERWDSLQDGTALKPIELDSDQEGRRILRESRIAEAKSRRAEEKEEARLAKQAPKDAKHEKTRKKMAKRIEMREIQQARAAEKEETRRIAEERKAGKTEKIEARKEAQREWKAAIDEKKRIKELEERIYRNITGKALNRMRRVTGHESVNDDESVDDADDENEMLDDERGVASDCEGENAEMVDLFSDREEDQFPDGKSTDDEDVESNIDVIPPKSQSTAKKSSEPRVGKVIPENPRSIMTDEELRVLLHERGLPRRGANESHRDVVARLDAADHALPAKDVRVLLAKYFDHKIKGNKFVCIHKLQTNDAANSAAGAHAVKSQDPDF